MPGPGAPYSQLDYGQVIRQVYDETTDRLRVDTEATVVAGAMEVAISMVDDSIKIGDGTDILQVNPDGSINVNSTTTTAGPKLVINSYNEISSLASGSETTISTYTAPLGKISYLTRIEAAGSNIAQYRVFHNATAISKYYTNFGADLSTSFDFTTNVFDFPGFKIPVGDTITIKVLHSRPYVGDFNARIQTVEVG